MPNPWGYPVKSGPSLKITIKIGELRIISVSVSEKIRKIGENELKNWKYIPFWNKLIKKREKLWLFCSKLRIKYFKNIIKIRKRSKKNLQITQSCITL